MKYFELKNFEQKKNKHKSCIFTSLRINKTYENKLELAKLYVTG